MQIGVVVPDLRDPGGIAEEAVFVARSLRTELAAAVRIVSLATSSRDESSLLLRHPGTWTRHAAGSYRHQEFTVAHFGAFAADIELARYRRRRALLDGLADCDVVHVIGGTPAWGHAVRGFRGPLVLHFASFARHERTTHVASWRSPVDAWRSLMTTGVAVVEKAALRRADVVIAMNETRRGEAQAITGTATPVMTVHTGVDTERFRPGPYDSSGYLLTVGRLNDPRKNLPLLLRAYAEARRQSASVPRLVLVGHRGPTAESWRLVSELGLGEHVDYRGALNRDQLTAAYRGASAFVLSSDEEGLGIVILEAMASGVPVIATSCIGPTETVTDGGEGLLVPVRSVAPLAAAIARVSDDEALRRRLSQAARQRAVREFSLETAAARLGNAYRSTGLARDAAAASLPFGRLSNHSLKTT